MFSASWDAISVHRMTLINVLNVFLATIKIKQAVLPVLVVANRVDCKVNAHNAKMDLFFKMDHAYRRRSCLVFSLSM